MAPERAGLSYNGDLHTLACHDKGKAAAKNLAMLLDEQGKGEEAAELRRRYGA